MPSDARRLATHTHLDHGTAIALLETRSLTGDPEKHDHPAIILTEDEVVVETATAFARNTRTTPPIHLAFTCNTTVEQMRHNDEAASQLMNSDPDESS